MNKIFLRSITLAIFTILWVFQTSALAVDLKKTFKKAIVHITIEGERASGGKIKNSGSGFILNKNGYILTNSHIVPDPEKFKYKSLIVKGSIGSTDSHKFNLQIIKRDLQLDLALLRVPLEYDEREENFNFVKIGDSNSVKSQDTVYVLGYPKDLPLSVTSGIISNTLAMNGWFQTNVALNPGNSGGPVFNKDDVVVAIVQGGIPGAQGLNFLIPINYAGNLLNLLARPRDISLR